MAIKRTKPPVEKKGARVQPGTFLDSNLYRQARSLALVQGRNVGELIDDAIKDYLAKHGMQKPT